MDVWRELAELEFEVVEPGGGPRGGTARRTVILGRIANISQSQDLGALVWDIEVREPSEWGSSTVRALDGALRRKFSTVLRRAPCGKEPKFRVFLPEEDLEI